MRWHATAIPRGSGHAGSLRAAATAGLSRRAPVRFAVCTSPTWPQVAVPMQAISLPVGRALDADDSQRAQDVQTHFDGVSTALSGSVGKYSARRWVPESAPWCVPWRVERCARAAQARTGRCGIAAGLSCSCRARPMRAVIGRAPALPPCRSGASPLWTRALLPSELRSRPLAPGGWIGGSACLRLASVISKTCSQTGSWLRVGWRARQDSNL